MAVSPAQSLACLWGSTIKEFSVRADLAEIFLRCQVVENDASRCHVLKLTGVSSLCFERHTPLPWDYCELTAIEVEAGAGQWQVRMELWSQANNVELSCRCIQLDGIDLPEE